MELIKYRIRLTFTSELLGSSPAREAILTEFITSKAIENGDMTIENGTEEEDILKAVEERYDWGYGLTIFPRDDKGLFLWNYQIKGFLKNAGNVMKDNLKVKALRSKVNNFLFVMDRRNHLYRDGGIIQEEDDIFERPLRADTARGPRIALSASERIIGGHYMECTLGLITNNAGLTWDVVKGVLDYGQLSGLGQWRNGGHGTFTWELLES